MKTKPIEQSLGERIDALYKQRQVVKEAKAKIKIIEDEETRLENELIDAFAKAELDGAKGKLARVEVGERRSAVIKDYEAFEKFVIKNKMIAFLQRRAALGTIDEYIERTKKLPPGIEIFTKPGLTVTAIKSKA